MTRNRASGSVYHNLHQALFERANRITRKAVFGTPVVLPCHAGNGFATVDAQGRVLLCEERPDVVLGHLKDWNWDLRKLLKDPEIADRIPRLTEGCFCRSDCVIRYNLTRAPKQYPGVALEMLRMAFKSLRMHKPR